MHQTTNWISHSWELLPKRGKIDVKQLDLQKTQLDQPLEFTDVSSMLGIRDFLENMESDPFEEISIFKFYPSPTNDNENDNDK